MVIGNTAESACPAASYEVCTMSQENGDTTEGNETEIGTESTEEAEPETESVTESTEEWETETETSVESSEEPAKETETAEESSEETMRETETAVESSEEPAKETETSVESEEESEEEIEASVEDAEETEAVTEEAVIEAETAEVGIDSTEEETETDDREVSVEIPPGLVDANVKLMLTGEKAGVDDTYILFYYREITESETAQWESDAFRFWLPRKYSYTISDLKADTAYEYVLGIGTSYKTAKNELKKVVTGSFQTGKDERVLQEVAVCENYEDVILSAAFTGNQYETFTVLQLYYKEQSADTWEKTDPVRSWDETFQYDYTVGTAAEPLKQGTSYDYVLIMSESSNTPDSPDEVAEGNWKKAGSFQTKKREFTLSVEADEENTTFDTGVLRIGVKGTDVDDKLYVRLALKEDNNKHTAVVCKAKNYTEILKITGLDAGKQYTVTDAEIYILKNKKEIILDTVSVNVSFTTKVAEEAKSISLSETKIYLNVNDRNGYDLDATVLPEGAEQQVEWSSDNKNIAYVYNTGMVYSGSSTGETVITATVADNDQVSASCTVVVVDYMIGKKTESGYETVEELNIARGESVENLVMLKREGEELIPLEKFEVEIEYNDTVAWKNGKLTGITSGKTKVSFKKDNIKCSFKVNVTEETRNFVLTGLDASDKNYPALKKENGAYEIACKKDEILTYQVLGKVNSGEGFEAENFQWSSSNSEVAEVEAGVVTPKSAGEVTIKAVHNGNAGEKEIKLIVKETAEVKADTVYALTNLKKKMCLKDIDLVSVTGEGWEWKTPNTLLYALPTGDGIYLFEAVYKGTDKYPCEELIKVHVGTFTGLSVNEVEGNHNHVLQTEQDKMYLQVVPEYAGSISQKYSTYIPAVDGLKMEWDEANSRYVITASKTGKYVLKPEIRVQIGEEEKTILTGKYEMKAVKEAQVCSIEVTTDTEGVRVSQTNGLISLNYSEEAKQKKINLKAVAKDKDGNETETVLEWKIANKNVAAVKYNKKSSHQAEMTVKGKGGNTILTVKAKDAAGYTAAMAVEIRDLSPRVDKTKVTVNTAYEKYNYGLELAEDTGALIEIKSAYNNAIRSHEIYKEDKKTVAPEFELEMNHFGKTDTWYVLPVDETVKPGTYKYYLGLKTADGEEMYYYPLTIKVVNKMPSVKVSMDKINLFYLDDEAALKIKISGKNYGVEEVKWEDNSKQSGNGFALRYSENSGEVTQKGVTVKDGKLTDESLAKGTLYVKLEGYIMPVEIKNFKINYTYKKPTLSAKLSTTVIAPEMGATDYYFTIYDEWHKCKLDYRRSGTQNNYDPYFDQIGCDNDDIKMNVRDNGLVDCTYIGTDMKKQENVSCQLDSETWREPLEVKYTLKKVTPTVKLEKTSVVLNKEYTNVELVKIETVQNVEGAWLQDVKAVGTDKKAQELIDKGILRMEIRYPSGGCSMQVYMNSEAVQSENIKSGTYTFKVTPYYNKKSTGEKTAANTLKLKVKITDKPVSVKVTANGTLNLLCNDMVSLNPVFSNIGDNYSIVSARITGDYAKHFALYRFQYGTIDQYYILRNETGKLKAGQTYKLTIEYTLKTSGGDKLVVSGDLKMTPKAKLPKLTVMEKEVCMYACDDSNGMCRIRMPLDDGRFVQEAYGELDCNKDGIADIVAELEGTYSINGSLDNYSWAKMTVKIVNRDAVAATDKGKTYKVPVTVKFKGRDGISKDAQVNVNVKVKR